MVGDDFIQDLGLVMLVAAAAGWGCRRLELPLVLGYIMAGILVGPYVPFFAMVEDPARIHALAQVGLVFLVFQIGQGLKLQQLKTMGAPLVLATLVTAILVFNGSRIFAQALGWPAAYGLVLAGMLMVSSTAIIAKTLRESNAIHSTFGQIVLTMTALDDLVAVVMLTLLTLIGTSSAVAAGAVVQTGVSLAAVMASMLALSVWAFPRLLKKLDRTAPPELRTLLVAGLLLVMALISSKAGFSAAIGAFLLGSVVASTGHKLRFERSLGALCEVFGALFFVAVGMLLDLRLLGRVWPFVLLAFGFALVWRSLASTLALLLVGCRPVDAIRSGVCLTPIGEFSLIIALAAVQAGLTPDWFYALAMGLCLLSAVTTPLLVRRAGGISEWIQRRQPEFAQKAVSFYHDWVQSFRHRQRSSLFWRLTGPRWLQILGQVLFISGVLVFAKPSYQWVEKWLSPDWPASNALPSIFWFGFLLLLLAPLVALWRTIQAVSMVCAEAATRGHRHRVRLQPAFETLLHGAGYVAVLLWISMFIPYETMPIWSAVFLVVVVVVLAMVFRRKLVRWHSRFEIALKTQLSDTGLPGCSRVGERWQQHSDRWRLGIREHVVGEETRAAGKAIRDLPLRQLFSCTVVGIERQGCHLPNPAADTVLYPDDKLLLLGSEPALKQAEQWLSAAPAEGGLPNGKAAGLVGLCLEQVVVPPGSRHIGKTLGELRLMQRLGIQIVGVERDGEARIAVGKLDVLLPGDRLLVLGRPDQISDMAFWLTN